MKDYHINIFYSDEDEGYIADFSRTAPPIHIEFPVTQAVHPVCCHRAIAIA